MADLMEGLAVCSNGLTRRSPCDSLSSPLICVKLLVHETVSSLQNPDASPSTQDDLSASENAHESTTFVAEDTSGNPLIDGSKSARFIAIDGTV